MDTKLQKGAINTGLYHFIVGNPHPVKWCAAMYMTDLGPQSVHSNLKNEVSSSKSDFRIWLKLETQLH